MTELRRQVRGTQSTYLVVKNTLALRATKGTALEAVAEHFTGATAVAYNRGNPVALAKVLTAFAKTNPNLVFKAAVIDGHAVAAAEIKTIAELPTPRGAGVQAALPHAVADAAPGDGVERAGPQPRGRGQSRSRTRSRNPGRRTKAPRLPTEVF